MLYEDVQRLLLEAWKYLYFQTTLLMLPLNFGALSSVQTELVTVTEVTECRLAGRGFSHVEKQALARVHAE